MTTIDDILAPATVIPVLEVADVGKAGALGLALARGGLKVLELTMRTEAALEALAMMKKAAPSTYVGMGTVLTAKDAEAALAAGADFLVTPGLSPSLREALLGLSRPVLPGVATASELMAALDAGFTRLKFFPAEPAGGVTYLKSLYGPFAQARFCPTGGISAEKAPDYLALPNVLCVGGSWIATPALIAADNWSAIEANARRAASLVKA